MNQCLGDFWCELASFVYASIQVVKEVTDIKCELAAIKSLQSDFNAARRQAKMDAARDQLRLLECKICRDTPSSVTCCKQVLGCQTCFQTCMEQSECCPLCRDQEAESIVVEGLDTVYTLLKQNLELTEQQDQ